MEDLNMRVINCSTAASYFHALRTHMRMPYRKPMIVISPKKLLKFKDATSNIEDFEEGTRFKYLLHDCHPNLVAPEQVKKVIFCSG
jgi:2-oxoglutarate dehydrogenase E1 component